MSESAVLASVIASVPLPAVSTSIINTPRSPAFKALRLPEMSAAEPKSAAPSAPGSRAVGIAPFSS